MNGMRLILLILTASITLSQAAEPTSKEKLNWGTGAVRNAAAAAAAPPAGSIPASALKTAPFTPAGRTPSPPPTPFGGSSATSPSADVHQTKAFGPLVGAAFNIACARGDYVVGFFGTTGAWFDQLTVACGHWDATANTIRGFQPLDLKAGTSGGGKPNYSYCNGDEVVTRLAVQMMQSDPARMVLDNIQFDCAAAAPPHAVVETESLETQESSGGGFRGQPAQGNFTCGPGEFAVGIYGNADQFVHRVGLSCRAGPSPASAAPTLSTQLRATHDVVPPPSPLAHGGRALGAANLNWVSAEAATSMSIAPAPATPGPSARPTAGATPPGVASQPPFDLPNGPTAPISANAGMRFNFPHIRTRDGKQSLLDACATGGGGCGQTAANAFCHVAQPAKPAIALDYKTFRGTGRDGRTVSLPSYSICTGNSCSGFLYVVCKS